MRWIKRPPPGVRYVSWPGVGGYPSVARHYMQALLRGGRRLEWIPVAPGSLDSQPDPDNRRARRTASKHSTPGVDQRALTRCIGRPVDPTAQMLHVVPEMWHNRLAEGIPTLGITVWETDRLPAEWPDIINATDGVIVPSEFNAQVFADSGISCPIHVVPHIAPSSCQTITDRQMEEFRRVHGIPTGHTVVYFLEAWTVRKGPWRNLRAFLDAFDGIDGITLVVKSDELGQRSAIDIASYPVVDQVEAIVERYTRPPPVVVIAGDVASRTIEVLHAVGDVYLSLTHGEGWGLGVFEAAAASNPVITTGWGAVTDFLGVDWPGLVDFELVPVVHARDHRSYGIDQRWASPSHDHAVDLLRATVADLPSQRASIGTVAHHLQTSYTEGVVGPLLIQTLDSI
ncbi:MAG: glycosyltransferase family 4 protein [Actinomycetia bacterium]|nr:glycosyltransferase family 4 protein [Actinomycetes bacterium]